MFPVMTVLWPLTLCSHDVKGGYVSRVLGRDDRQPSQLLPVGPLCPPTTATASYLCCCPLIPEQAQGAVPQGPTAAIPGTRAGLWSKGSEAAPGPRCPWGSGRGEQLTGKPKGEEEEPLLPCGWGPQEETALRMGARAWGESTQVHSARGPGPDSPWSSSAVRSGLEEKSPGTYLPPARQELLLKLQRGLRVGGTLHILKT